MEFVVSDAECRLTLQLSQFPRELFIFDEVYVGPGAGGGIQASFTLTLQRPRDIDTYSRPAPGTPLATVTPMPRRRGSQPTGEQR